MTARRTIEVVDHDPAWAERFAAERQRLLAAVRDAGAAPEVVAVEHMGSTAVPGLAAKPVVDIMIGLRRYPASGELIRCVEACGYIHRGEAAMVGRHYFADAPPKHPRTRQIHAVEHRSWFWHEHLRLRDHLRTHPEDVAAYAEAKRDLARRHPHDPIAYTEGKTEVIRRILARARSDAGRIHDAAEVGFGTDTARYERSRPSYPAAAVDHLADRLGIGPSRHVVDVGAGTGKLTRLLAPSGARVTAVEPVAAMRSALSATGPSVEVLDGTGEELPLTMGSVDVLVSAQAFHWFDAAAALSEAYRVLRPEGGVGLVWNVRDESVDWMAEWTRIVEPVSAGAPRERLSRWKERLATTELFGPVETAVFDNPHIVPKDLVVDRVASTSFVAALEPDRRDDLLRRFRHLLDTHPQTRGEATISVPYRTEVHTFRRVP